ncbi:hypothetical protein [Celerinatantimonas diazotrophica]|uniref:Copper resistance protein D n=1 Tax=Celerinatantimonas diazotrophica TaxID=412034 RepID=A0A4R1K4I9_9GAMM|nr:hypothetical protein [Celerinatantimonas diazotrophica]TCK59056.1 hypothetical protein EV690_1220 [Celerinatantimonas diazotrophica]CAG9297691.1 hypothetical protein CEDIAZO_02880 [Celerinatantimonas diazotrophica]
MSTLYQSLAIILAPTAAYSFLLLMLVHYRGQICAGQRSRLSQQFGTLWSLSSLGLVSTIVAQRHAWLIIILLTVSVLCGWILSIKQLRLANKRTLDTRIWWLSGAPLIAAALIISAHHRYSILAMLLAALAVTHWIMVKAKHRLSAFDRILPICAIAVLALTVCLCALQIYQYGEQPLLAALTHKFIHLVGFSLAGMLIWLLPLLKDMEPTAGQLGATSLSLIIAGIAVTELQFLLQ